jgi:hypothetical protein
MVIHQWPRHERDYAEDDIARPIIRILNDDLWLFSLRCTFLIDYPTYQPARPSLMFP